MRRIWLAWAVATLSAHPASAACLPLLVQLPPSRLTEATITAAGIKGWQPVPFLKDKTAEPGCPMEDQPSCAKPDTVTPGEVVLLNGVEGGEYACATFVRADGATVSGWLASWRLAIMSRTVPEPDDWAGRWVAPGRSIAVALTASGELSVRGEAEGPAGVGAGGFAARLEPSGPVLGFTQDGGRTLGFDDGGAEACRVQMARRGPYLVVEDGGGCGAVFTDVYRRG